jgi:hypothetical protein
LTVMVLSRGSTFAENGPLFDLRKLNIRKFSRAIEVGP